MAKRKKLHPVDKIELTDFVLAPSSRILVLDDDTAILQMLEVMLQELGFDVSLATDGKEAIAMYQTSYDNNEPYHLVITDLTIPGGMGGLEAAQGILKINPQAILIVSSGYAMNPVMANYKEYGFREALAKPFQFLRLKKVLQTALQS